MALTGPSYEDILQAARAWLKLAGGGLIDDQVIPADADGGRPPVPYLTVGAFADRLGAGGLSVPELVDSVDGDDPTRQVSQRRAITLSVTAYGRGAAEWVREADLLLALPSAMDQLAAADLVVVQGASAAPQVVTLGTDREYRAVFDFEARYRVVTSAETMLEAEQVALSVDLVDREPDPDPLTMSATVDLTA